MNCREIQKLIHAHQDGELDAAHLAQVDEHLAGCRLCSNAARNLAALRNILHKSELSFRAPAALRQKIRSATRPRSPARRNLNFAWPWWRNFGLATALVIAALTFAFQFYYPRNEGKLLAELSSSHVRSLMVNHLTDVVSSDQHTVKPWFDGKLDYAPPVLDLSGSGFPLFGGRLDFVDERPVAALVYARQKHIINLFIWPAKSSAVVTPQIAERNGYHFVHWANQRMDYWAVSDVNAKNLLEFAKTWAAATAGDGTVTH